MSKNAFFQAITSNDALTANGAVTHSTSQSALVDLFFLAGACRTMDEARIKVALERAFVENPLLTLKTIFWAGDIRQGAGERRFFRLALKFLETSYPETLRKNLGLVPFFNRWDSLFDLKDEAVLDLVKTALDNKDGLAAKWLPREHSNKFQDLRLAFQKKFKINSATYRKLVASLSKTVEQQMSKKEWDKIIYEHVPSVAMNKYRKAFYRNDEDRYTQFIAKVTSGEAKINAGAIFPHDLYKALKRGDQAKAVEAQWSALPNYLEGSSEKILPVCDVSGSMEGDPMAISVALGIYLSERNNSIFKDGFITFSSTPQLQYLKGTFSQKVAQLERAPWEMTTNLQAVFDLILVRAKGAILSPEEMPTTLLIISDMEFDCADRGNKTNFEVIREKYAASGYTLPKIVFWNVNATAGNLPVKMHETGTALISGASPTIVKSVLSGEISPMKVIENTLSTARYEAVCL